MTMHISDELYLTEVVSTELIHEVNLFHPSKDKEERFTAVREACEELMQVVCNNCPMCDDRVEALKSIRLVRMWANSSIALEKRE